MSDVCKHCVQRRLPGSLPDRRHHPDRVRHGRHPGRRLQRLPRLHRGLPVRRIEINPVSQHGAEVHALLRPAAGRAEPACAQACPTESIQFGPIEELHGIANERVQQLNAQARDAGQPENAYLYGADD